MNKLNPMDTAPRDRAILLRMNDEYTSSRVEQFAVAEFAVWESNDWALGHRSYGIWEIAPGEGIRMDDSSLMGWYELPE